MCTLNRVLNLLYMQIIRHGLWFKDIAHGRAYGHGIYSVISSAMALIVDE